MSKVTPEQVYARRLARLNPELTRESWVVEGTRLLVEHMKWDTAVSARADLVLLLREQIVKEARAALDNGDPLLWILDLDPHAVLDSLPIGKALRKRITEM